MRAGWSGSVPTFISCLTLITCASASHAATIHVPADQPTIQAGIDAASAGDTVMIRCGTYTWTGEGTGTSEGLLRLKSRVHLTSETGDPSCVVIDAERRGRVAWARHAAEVSLAGLTITGGLAGHHSEGGGLRFETCSGRILDCRIAHNETFAGGGGVQAVDSPLEIVGSTFEANFASWGGGVCCDRPMTIRGCTFERNGAGEGGGLYGAASIDQCRFIGNTSSTGGGGSFHGNEDITNSVFAGNVASEGGAVCAWGSPDIENCTFYGNRGWGHALYCGSRAAPLVRRCIISWADDVGGRDYPVECLDASADPRLICCDVYQPLGAFLECIQGQGDWYGNFSADPMFCNALAFDFGLEDSSPCLPGRHPEGADCGLIGASGAGCGPTATRSTRWGALKRQFR